MRPESPALMDERVYDTVRLSIPTLVDALTTLLAEADG